MHEDRPGYLPLRDAAAWAGVSPRTLRRWISGGLPVYRGTTRGKLLIRPGDLDAFLTRHQAATPNLSALADQIYSDLRASGRNGSAPRRA